MACSEGDELLRGDFHVVLDKVLRDWYASKHKEIELWMDYSFEDETKDMHNCVNYTKSTEDLQVTYSWLLLKHP